MLRGPNPAWGLRLRQDRVSHLRVHAAQEARHLARGDRLGRGPRPGRVHVVPVVRADHRAVPSAPSATARRMALLLTRGCPAGPLARPEARMGAEEGLAERTASATGTPWGSGGVIGHERTHLSHFRWTQGKLQGIGLKAVGWRRFGDPPLFPGTSHSSLASVQDGGGTWGENYDFAFGDLPGEALSCFDSCMRQLGPWMLMMMEWWIMRSTIAVVTTGSPR
jgi:hypothetical protein